MLCGRQLTPQSRAEQATGNPGRQITPDSQNPLYNGGAGADASESLNRWKGDSFAAMGAKFADVSAKLTGSLSAPKIGDYQEFNTFLDCFDPQLDTEEQIEKQDPEEYKKEGKKDGFLNAGRKGSEEKTPRCSYCWPKRIYLTKKDCEEDTPKPNHGEVWQYWWPEYELEVNNFGVSAINPAAPPFNRSDMTYDALRNSHVAAMKSATAQYQQSVSDTVDMDSSEEHCSDGQCSSAKLLDKSLTPKVELSLNQNNPAPIALESTVKEILSSLQNYTEAPSGMTSFGGLNSNNQFENFEVHTFKTHVTTLLHTKDEQKTETDKDGPTNFWVPDPDSNKDKCIPKNFHYNGYIKGRKKLDFQNAGGVGAEPQNKENEIEGGSCFGDALPTYTEPGNWVGPWSEQPGNSAPWRNRTLADQLNQQTAGKACGSKGGCSGGSKKGGGGGMKMPKMPKMPGGGKGGGGGGGGEDYYSSDYYRSSSSSSINFTNEGCFILDGKLFCPVSSSSSSSSSSSLSSSSSSSVSSTSSNSNSSSSSSVSCAIVDGITTCSSESSSSLSQSQSDASVSLSSVGKSSSSNSSASLNCVEMNNRLFCADLNRSASSISYSVGSDIFNSSYSLGSDVYNSSLTASQVSSIGGLVNAFRKKELKLKVANNNQLANAPTAKSLQLKSAVGDLADGAGEGLEEDPGLANINDPLRLASLEEVDVCRACRAGLWPEMSLGGEQIIPVKQKLSGAQCEICYPAGQLYPTVGQLSGNNQESTSAAIMARRFAELVKNIKQAKGKALRKSAMNYSKSWKQDGLFKKSGLNLKYGTPLGGTGTDGLGAGSAFAAKSDFPVYTDFEGEDPSAGVKKTIDKIQPVYPTVGACNKFVPGSPAGNSGTMNKIVAGIVHDFSNDFPAAFERENWHSFRLNLWNRRTACTCQYKSVVQKNQSNGVLTAIETIIKENDKDAGDKPLYTKKDLKVILKDKKTEYANIINKIGDDKEGWGCQAYDGIDGKTKRPADPARGSGSSPEGKKDKFYDKMDGEKRFTDGNPKGDDNSRFACSAYQVYPFGLGFPAEKKEALRKCRERFEDKDQKKDNKPEDQEEGKATTTSSPSSNTITPTPIEQPDSTTTPIAPSPSATPSPTVSPEPVPEPTQINPLPIAQDWIKQIEELKETQVKTN